VQFRGPTYRATGPLNSAIGYIPPKDMLAGRQQEIHAERDRKLDVARKQRRFVGSRLHKELQAQSPVNPCSRVAAVESCGFVNAATLGAD
jgi:hypothetical protein